MDKRLKVTYELKHLENITHPVVIFKFFIPTGNKISLFSRIIMLKVSTTKTTTTTNEYRTYAWPFWVKDCHVNASFKWTKRTHQLSVKSVMRSQSQYFNITTSLLWRCFFKTKKKQNKSKIIQNQTNKQNKKQKTKKTPVFDYWLDKTLWWLFIFCHFCILPQTTDLFF